MKHHSCSSLAVPVIAPESPARQDWVRVPTHAPLLLPLVTPGYVVADIPVFYVIARDTAYYRDTIGKAAVSTLVVPDLPPPPSE